MMLPWITNPPLDSAAMEEIRRRCIFECCKWDPQVGDAQALSDWPIVIAPQAWMELRGLAERLAAETLEAERELLNRPELHAHLGLGWRLRQALKRARQSPAAGAARLMRFDFHFTTDGWRISEVNSDVPGGFNEAAGFSRLVGEHVPDARGAGDVAESIAGEIVRTAGAGSVVALAHATAYSDDHQAMVYLAKTLEAHGARPVLVSPAHLRWQHGRARIQCAWHDGPAAAVFRFFPAEWLPNLGWRSHWASFFAESETPICNPAFALLTQSKRFPLVWDRLRTDLPTWRMLLPETRDPREANRENDAGWVLKPACGRVGELIGLEGATDAREWKIIRKSARRWPRHWIAQRRFETIPIQSHGRSAYACIGVYTVSGRACGIYGRTSPNPLINHQAQDTAVLIAEAAAVPRANTEAIHDPIRAI